jgi:hypothetical protein
MRTLLLSMLALAWATPAAAQDTAMERGAYEARVQDLSHQTRQLGSDVAASLRRLALLQESMVRSDYGRVRVRLRLDVPPIFRLVAARVGLDGAPIFDHLQAEGFGREGAIELFEGPLPSGSHVLSVRLDYVGADLGLFPYHRGFRFRVRGSSELRAEPGEVLELDVVGTVRGGPHTPFEERLTLEFRSR